jgi:hypothetical protein
MDKTVFLIAISLGGACHGGYMTFIPVFVRNEFGLNHLGKILGFLTSGNALGSLIIADFFFIIPYNLNSSEKGECYGARCFAISFILTTVLFSVNLFLSIILLKDYMTKVGGITANPNLNISEKKQEIENSQSK